MSNPYACAYVVAARRSALGRIGGLHRARRIEDLAAPVLSASLADAGIEPGEVDEVIIGSASAGGNPARLIALAAGLPEHVPASTIDRQCASGLDAIVQAIRSVATGAADVVVAGGAESLSTAPWRVAKPRTLHHLPRFMELHSDAEAGEPRLVEAAEAVAQRYQISRERQDEYAATTRRHALEAHEAHRFSKEIVPIKMSALEARDESLGTSPDLAEIAELPAFAEPDGTVTSGNTSAMHDGAAMVVVVSEAVYQRLGRPPALRLVASAAAGAGPGLEATAPIEATQKLLSRLNGNRPAAVDVVELSETSAAQAIAFRDNLGLRPDGLNSDGGALARGHPYGASGAVVVVRLFTRLVRHQQQRGTGFGLAATSALGGLGVSALFEAV